MPRKSDIPLVKKTMNFYEGDTDKLDSFFPRLGYSAVVRDITHRLVKRLEEKLNQQEIPDARNLESSLSSDIERSVTDQLK